MFTFTQERIHLIFNLSSTSVLFRPTTGQMPNLILVRRKGLLCTVPFTVSLKKTKNNFNFSLPRHVKKNRRCSGEKVTYESIMGLGIESQGGAPGIAEVSTQALPCSKIYLYIKNMYA
jgi:hypothetical protein